MTRDTCRLPTCSEEPGQVDDEHSYRDNKFCCPFHEVKFEHIRADAKDAKRDDQRRR